MHRRRPAKSHCSQLFHECLTIARLPVADGEEEAMKRKMVFFAMLVVLAVLVSGAFFSHHEANGRLSSAAQVSTAQDGTSLTEFLNATTSSCSSSSTAC